MYTVLTLECSFYAFVFRILDGMDEPRSNLRLKHGRGTAYGDSGNTSESEDEQSMDDEENYREDESSL